MKDTIALMPKVTDVAELVRKALHSPDPIDRAEARAYLESLNLPVSPAAIVLAGRLVKAAP